MVDYNYNGLLFTLNNVGVYNMIKLKNSLTWVYYSSHHYVRTYKVVSGIVIHLGDDHGGI